MDIRISIENLHFENNVRTLNYKSNFRKISLMELENVCMKEYEEKERLQENINCSKFQFCLKL